MQTTFDVFKLGQAHREAADIDLISALYGHLKFNRATPVKVPEHSSLGCWLRLYRKARNHPNVRLPFDLSDLAPPHEDASLELPAHHVLNFYGYPYPHNRGQVGVITQAMDQLNSFATPKAGLDDSFRRLNEDLHQIADQLEGLLEEDDFSLFSAYKTYVKLDSGSFWATSQQTGAALLTAITRATPFLALDATWELQPGAYAFDPSTRCLSGKNARGWQVDIGIEHLLALPLEEPLKQLIEVAEQLGTFVHQSGLFSLAQLLTCHHLPVPDTRTEARLLIAHLRRSTPLTRLPVSDLAGSDQALMQHLHWLALDHDRSAMAEGLNALIKDKDRDTVIDTASVKITPDPDSSARYPHAMRHPAVNAKPACGAFSLKQLLLHHQFAPPNTVGAAHDTLQNLQMNLPRRPEFGDYHALLDTTAESPIQLGSEQRQIVLETLNGGTPHGPPRLLDRLCGSLLAGKGADEIRAQADFLLKQLLGLAPARQSGRQLVTALQWYGQHPDEFPSQTSLDLLMLSALILDLDPTAGGEAYALAGFNLANRSHAGKPYADLRREFELHLVRNCNVSTAAAPLAAHLLLAGAAPEFLVQALPATLRFRTSIAWRVFKQGVMMAQALAPGSPRQLSYDDIIALASQPPMTLEQHHWYEYTATSTLLDWAMAVGELPERDNTPYSVDDMTALQTRLTQRLHALKEALMTFADEPPTRRSIALADLKRVFAQQPLLETDCLWRPVPPLAGSSLRFPMHHHHRQNYSLHSLVELHMDGQLGDTRWQSIEPQLDLLQLRPSFKRLGNINQRFDRIFGAYIERMKHAYSTTLEDLLAQLPLTDRLHLQQADVQLLVLKKAPGKEVALLSAEEEIARTARMGAILRGTSPTAVYEYELFPLLNRVHKRSGPPLVFREGGTPMTVTTGSAQSTRPVTQLLMGDELPVDWAAYATGGPPRPGVNSTVIVHVLWSSTSLPSDSPPTAPLTFGSSVNRAIAQAIVQRHFFLDVDALRLKARGSTRGEQRQRQWGRLQDRLKAFVPLWSCSEDIASVNGRRVIDGIYACFIDLLLLLFPARQFVNASLALLKKTTPVPIKLLQLSRLSSAFLNNVLNPLDSLPGLFRLARNGLIQLSSGAQLILDSALGHVQRLAADSPLFDYPTLLARANIGSGSLLRGSDLLRINAILHKHRWHACYPFSTRAYGPPLKHFRLDSALGVTPMHAANGYRAWVTERLFASPPLLIPRAGITDLLDNNSLLRLEHRAPTHMDELTSPAYFKVLEGFDSVCAPARNTRSPIPLICFTKKLATYNASIQQRRGQAIEHIRLVPAAAVGAGKRQLIFNRRLYEATPQGLTFEMTPVAMSSPLAYKPSVSGRLIHNEAQFGLPNDQLDNLLSRDTRVVELVGLTEGIDDRRTLRAMAIDLDPPGATPGTRIVVEADAGAFYQATPIAPAPALRFDRLDFNQGGEHERLIRAFCQRKLDYLTAGGFALNRPLVNLPTLEVLTRQLASRGLSPTKLARLNAQASHLKKSKQRELLLNASDQGQRLGMSVAVAPIRLQTWPPYTPHSAKTVNQYFATQAFDSTRALVKSTGIGPANVVGVGTRELERLAIAEPLTMWQYSVANQPNYTEVILRTGAGNCDQMAHVAAEMIKINGGAARVWGMTPPAHAFVVVGTPPATLRSTQDFAEPGWAGLWICDPWAKFVCPASDYMRLLNEKMIVRYLEDTSIFFNDQGTYRWARSNDPAWLSLLNDGIKRPMF